MTIEISLEDLIHLAETARLNGSSVMYVTRSTDGKRATLLVTAAPRKHRSTRPAAAKNPNTAA